MKTKLAALTVVSSALLLAACKDDNNTASACTGNEAASERVFLQQLSDSSVIIKWRGDATAACLGTSQDGLDTLVEATETEAGHMEARFDGLDADTTYYYSVGGAATAPASQVFKTAPLASGYPADDANVRIWAVGDSGTEGYTTQDADATLPNSTHYAGGAAAVLEGMETFTAAEGEKVDLFLLLGDNAYNNGSDVNYQAAMFDVYPDLMKQAGVWPTIGNHEMGVAYIPAYGGYYGGISTASSPDQFFVDGVAAAANEPTLMPYMDIFTLPTAAEAGGVASSTEQYYSFDYGKVHVISLDSQLSARDETQLSTMKTWLENDLQTASASSDWIVVIFHHPPYSKGANHDSDHDASNVASFDSPILTMRNEFVPLFQQYGVDVVLNGHSHSYERSYYLTNLYDVNDDNPAAGDSASFNAAVHSQGAGNTGRDDWNRYAEEDGYVIYSVAGNGGKADTSGGSMTDWLGHQAHVPQPYADQMSVTGDNGHGLAITGSLLIDANASRLAFNMLDANGTVLDQFVIKK